MQKKGGSCHFKHICLTVYVHFLLSILQVIGGAMEEAGSRQMRMNDQDQLVKSKCTELSDTVLQSNCYSLENTGALEEADFRKHLGSTCCSQESREETPGREEARTDPPDGQQDPESEKHKEKTLGVFSLAFWFLNGFSIFVK